MSLWRRVFGERRAILVPLLALVIVDAVLLAGVVFPLRKVVSSTEDAATDTRATLAQANQRMRQMQTARTSRDRAEQELATFYGKILPTDHATSVRMLQLDLAKLARENGLHLGSTAYEDALVKDTNLKRMMVRVDLTGDYNAVLKFLYDVETSESFLVINSVALSQAIMKQQAAQGTLQLTVEVATYYKAAP